MESSPGPHRGFAGGDGEAAASVGPLDWAVRVTGAAGWPPAVRRVALGASGPGSTVLGVQGLTGGAQALHRWVRSDGRALGGACCPQDQLALEGSLALAGKVPRCQRRNAGNRNRSASGPRGHACGSAWTARQGRRPGETWRSPATPLLLGRHPHHRPRASLWGNIWKPQKSAKGTQNSPGSHQRATTLFIKRFKSPK